MMGPGGNRPLVLTDETGAFEFVDLPTGNFSLSADKPGFITSRYPEQTRTMRGNRPLQVSDGQTLTGIIVPMYRGGAITGRVIDAHGDPVEFAQIQMLRAAARGLPQSRGGTATNDLGEFRAPKLEPGSYFIVAVQRNQQPDDPSDAASLPTFYPGVVALDQAQPIPSDAGRRLTASISCCSIPRRAW